MKQIKILSFDIETSPIVAFSWGPMWETNLIEVTDHTLILSYSAKWFKGKHITKGWPNYKGYKKGVKNDKEIVKDIWNLLDEADIVVLQNGKAFDVKQCNSRFAFYGLASPSPFKVVDTKIEAKKYLRLPSYSLDNMCDYFGIGKKLEHEGFPLWKKCMAGDLKAWKRMLRYNKHDVTLTEQLYLKLRPFMKTHPNMGNYINKKICPRCSSVNLQSRGFSHNITTYYRRLRCSDCGAWAKMNENLQKQKLLTSI